jgi:hypothetical protein
VDPGLTLVGQGELANHAWSQEGSHFRAGIQEYPERPLAIDPDLEERDAFNRRER